MRRPPFAARPPPFSLATGRHAACMLHSCTSAGLGRAWVEAALPPRAAVVASAAREAGAAARRGHLPPTQASAPARRARAPPPPQASPSSSPTTPADDAAAADSAALRLPISAGDQADQAAAAVLAAHAAGATRLKVELLLPIIGASDLDDWPGGIRMQAKAALPLVERLLSAVKKGAPSLGGRMDARVLDDGDAVCAWTNDAFACVLFPTAETLKDVVAAAEARDGAGGLTLIVNPQWTVGPGQLLVPDFGFLGRAKKEAAANSFVTAYSLSQLRVAGDDTRLHFSTLATTSGGGGGGGGGGNAGAWTVWWTPDGSRSAAVPLVTQAARPSYKEVEALLVATPGTAAGLPPLLRAQREAAFIQRTLKDNVRDD